MVLLELIKTEHDLNAALQGLIAQASQLGWTLIKAFIIFIVGRFLIRVLNKFIRKILNKRNIEPSVRTFVSSLINVILMVLLIISVVGALGVQTTSFAALLASAGVAVGMALSGNLSNFAGGLIILIFKPYKVGDYIESQNVSGTVKEVQIFHTVLNTPDNKIIYVPNGSLSSSAVINYSYQTMRRVEWTFGVEYGTEYEKVKREVEGILSKDSRILSEPAPQIALNQLADSSVNFIVRVWVKSPDYWDVFFDINKNVYQTFNEAGINFPFPQLTVHQAKD